MATPPKARPRHKTEAELPDERPPSDQVSRKEVAAVLQKTLAQVAEVHSALIHQRTLFEAEISRLKVEHRNEVQCMQARYEDKFQGQQARYEDKYKVLQQEKECLMYHNDTLRQEQDTLQQENTILHQVARQIEDQARQIEQLQQSQQHPPVPAPQVATTTTTTTRRREWRTAMFVASHILVAVVAVLVAILTAHRLQTVPPTSTIRGVSETAQVVHPSPPVVTDLVPGVDASWLPSHQISAHLQTPTYNTDSVTPDVAAAPVAAASATETVPDIHLQAETDPMQRRLQHMHALHDAMQQRLMQKLTPSQRLTSDEDETAPINPDHFGHVEEFHPLPRQAPVHARKVLGRKMFQPVVLAMKASAHSAKLVLHESAVPTMNPIRVEAGSKPLAQPDPEHVSRQPAAVPAQPAAVPDLEAAQAMQQRLEQLRSRQDEMQKRLEERMTRVRQHTAQASDGVTSEPAFGHVEAFQPLPRVPPPQDASKVSAKRGAPPVAPIPGSEDEVQDAPVKHKAASFYQDCPCSRGRKA